MLTRQPKKMMILYILDILRKYTDADHRLSQREIEDILRTEYNMPADRKAVRRNLMNLIDSGYNIEYSESVRMIPNRRPENWRRATSFRIFTSAGNSPMGSCGC